MWLLLLVITSSALGIYFLLKPPAERPEQGIEAEPSTTKSLSALQPQRRKEGPPRKGKPEQAVDIAPLPAE